MVQKRTIKRINVEVPQLGLGLMRLPLKPGGTPADIDEEKAIEMVDYAIEHGVNYFDTAYMYHDGVSANFAGKALSRHPRNSYFLANKIPVYICQSPQEMDEMFEDQLKRCKTDYFDFYLVHAMDRTNIDKTHQFNTYEFLEKKRAEGKIRYLGFSFHDNAALLQQILNEHKWDFCQVQLNYLDWVMQRGKELYDVIEKNDIQCMVMEPVRGGYLAKFNEQIEQILKSYAPDASIASWGIRWAASLKNVATVLSGMSNMDQLKDNIATLSDFKPLTQEEHALLEKVREELTKVGSIPCTGCRYCMPCPAGVNIPGTFRAYNDYKQIGRAIIAISSYQHGMDESEKAINCVECGQCAEHCPQHLEIPTLLQKAHKELSEAITYDRMPGYHIPERG